MKKILMPLSILFAFLFVTGVQAADAPMDVDGATRVDVKQAEALFNDEAVIFIDPRKQSDFERGHIPGAIHLDIKSKTTSLTEASLGEAVGGDKATKIVFYCNGPSCPRSAKGCVMAAEWGYSNLFYFRDGMPAWEAAGLPVE